MKERGRERKRLMYKGRKCSSKLEERRVKKSRWTEEGKRKE